MKIAMIYLSGGGLSGGAATTLSSLVPLLAEDSRVDRLDLFLPPKAAGNFEFPVPVRTWPGRDRFFGSPALRREVMELQPDVVFIPTSVWLDFGEIPTVCMVRNMEATLMPFGGNPLSVGLKNLLRRAQARKACRLASRVIAVSEFVREFLIENWRVDAEKVGVVCHGVNKSAVGKKPAILQAEEPADFWFTAGSIIPYRGLADVISALGKSKDDNRRLLIAGSSVYSDAYEMEMKALAEQCGVSSRVTWLGHLGPAEMSWCYQRCRAFVMTSRVEACPNVVLEALGQGCLSISTTSPPMPEFFEDIALYYDPGDVEGLANQMDCIAGMSQQEQLSRQQAALARAEKFSWAVAAEKTISELLRCLE